MSIYRRISSEQEETSIRAKVAALEAEMNRHHAADTPAAQTVTKKLERRKLAAEGSLKEARTRRRLSNPKGNACRKTMHSTPS